MNGDNAPSSALNGVKSYLKDHKSSTLYLVGKKSILEKYKKKLDTIGNNYLFVYAEEEIKDSDSTTRLFKRKPNCSLIK